MSDNKVKIAFDCFTMYHKCVNTEKRICLSKIQIEGSLEEVEALLKNIFNDGFDISYAERVKNGQNRFAEFLS